MIEVLLQLLSQYLHRFETAHLIVLGQDAVHYSRKGKEGQPSRRLRSDKFLEEAEDSSRDQGVSTRVTVVKSTEIRGKLRARR